MAKRGTHAHGATTTEYAILAGLVSVAAIAAVLGFGREIRAIFEEPVTVLYVGDEEPIDVAVDTPDTTPVAAPIDPYDGWINEATFLMGTPDTDALDLAVGGPWAGVYGKDSDDTMNGTHGPEIFVGGPGNDTIHSWKGDDTYVYAQGDGQDSINSDTSGADRLIFTDIPSTEAEFLAGYFGGSSLRVTVPGGYVQDGMFFYKSKDYVIESIEFSDGVAFDLKATADKAANDAKKYGTINPTFVDEDIVHNDAVDNSYTIKTNISPANTMTFADTTYDDATFWATGDGRHLNVTTSSGDKVVMEYYLSDSNTLNHTHWSELNFKDVPRPTFETFLRRVAEDSKSTGEVQLTAYNDSMRHWASKDKGYTIKGQWGGADELHLMETSFDEAKLGVYQLGIELQIKDRNGNLIRIPTYWHKSVGNWIETITFKGEDPGFAAIKDRAIHDQKSGTSVYLTDYDDEVRHYRSVDKSYEIMGSKGGIDTLRFFETNHRDAEFTSSWNDLHIHLPDGDKVSVDTYTHSSGASAMEHIIFMGEEVSREDILNRIGDGPYIDPQAAPMVIRYDLDQPSDFIELPLVAKDVNVRIDWGDAQANAGCPVRVHEPARVQCSKGAIGSRTVKIYGDILEWSGSAYGNYETSVMSSGQTPVVDYWLRVTEDIVAVDAWGDTGITKLSEGFRGAAKLTSVPATLPTKIANLEQIFSGAKVFNGDLSQWNLSGTTNLQYAFSGARSFNRALNWDVSQVTDMSGMFLGAQAFSQNISDWQTGQVTQMNSMFEGAYAFNADLSAWCVSKINYVPSSFDLDATSWSKPRPNWGSCPAP